MEHIIQMAISIEDKRIVEKVEETAERQIIQTLTEEVRDVISEKRGWRGDERDYAPLKDMVSERVLGMLEENKDFILSNASKILADKLARSKAGKEILLGMKNSEANKGV